MRKILQNERAQSLVEVTVALSILAVVMTGVVTLAINAVGLMINSRMKTEAAAIAQQGIEVVKGSPSKGCNVLLPGKTYIILNNVLTPGPEQAINSYTRTIRIDNDDISGLANSDLALVTVTVSWSLRAQPSDLVLKQLVRIKE